MSGFPSPSKSAMTQCCGPLAAGKSRRDEKVLPSMPAPLPVKVGRNGALANAVKPPTVTVIGANCAPAGTVTMRLVELAEETDARTAPKKTMLLAAPGLKFTPEIVTC